MCTVHRNRTLSRWYIRNVYSAQKQNTFQMVLQKCVQCTETGHYPDSTSEMCTVHRNRTLSRWYFRNVYSAQKQNTFQMVLQKSVLCTVLVQIPTQHLRQIMKLKTCPTLNMILPATHRPAAVLSTVWQLNGGGNLYIPSRPKHVAWRVINTTRKSVASCVRLYTDRYIFTWLCGGILESLI
jgi:hypothetical protein